MGQHTLTSQGPRRPSAGGMRSKDKNTLSNIMCIAAHRSGITRISEKQAGGELRAKNPNSATTSANTTTTAQQPSIPENKQGVSLDQTS